ncbi:hypothetical protein MEO_05156 [Candida albicans P94015]|nr:hypothetical protein MEO_05156 [Candida albicans P94015]
MSTPLSSIRPSPGLEVVMSHCRLGKKRGMAQRMNRISRNLWRSITMTGRCSICSVYNSGWLVLEGVNKTVQESLASEHSDSGGVFPVFGVACCAIYYQV